LVLLRILRRHLRVSTDGPKSGKLSGGRAPGRLQTRSSVVPERLRVHFGENHTGRIFYDVGMRAVGAGEKAAIAKAPD